MLGIIIGILLLSALLIVGYVYRKQIKLIWKKYKKQIIAFTLASSMATGSLIMLPPEPEPINPFDYLPKEAISNFNLTSHLDFISINEGDISRADVYKNKAAVKLNANDGENAIIISYSNEAPILKSDKGVKVHYQYDDFETMIYPVQDDKIEFLLILHAQPKTNEIVFNLDIGDLSIDDNKIVNKNARLFNYDLFTFETPYIVDSNGETIKGELHLLKDKLIITIDQKFLDNAKYPIYIDPTVTWDDHIIDPDDNLQFDIWGIDLDDDGDTDVVTSDHTDINWFENDGSESWTQHTINASEGGWNIVVIDLDEDGDLDVVTACTNTQHVAWFENDGSESFTGHVINSSIQSYANAVCAGDLDDDGDIDIVHGDYSYYTWYENDGSESFTSHTILFDDNDIAPYGMEMVDLDEDGDQDIVTTSLGIGNDKDLCWLKNDGSESFTVTAVEIGDGTNDDWHDPHVQDIDKDGDWDIVAMEVNADNMIWLENDGSESFTAHNVDTDIGNGYYCSVNDINGDGEWDFADLSTNGDEVRIWINDGSESFTETVIGTLNAPYCVNISDVNSDGHMDILMGRYTDCRWYEQIPPNILSTNATNGTCFHSANLSGYTNWSGIVGFEWGLTDSYGSSYNLTRAECWEVDTSAEWNADGTHHNTEMYTNDGELNGNLILGEVSYGAWTDYWNTSTYGSDYGDSSYTYVTQKVGADLSGHDYARVSSYIKGEGGGASATARETFTSHSNEYQTTGLSGYTWQDDAIPAKNLGTVNWYILGDDIFGFKYWGYINGERLQYRNVSDYQDNGYWLSNWQSFPDDFLPANVTSDIDVVDGGIVNITLESSQDGVNVDESEAFTNLPVGVNINTTSISKAPYFRLNVSLEEGADTPQVNYVRLCGYNLTNGTFNYTASGLLNCTTYHYRSINNISGVIYTGDDKTFTTYCTPYISSINIENGSVISETSPTINITVIDNDNATMNITWYESVNCSVYVEDQTNTSVANNTNASWVYTNASSGGNTYCFKVVIDDYGCGGPIEYYFTFDVIYSSTVNISNSGRDYFCWKGNNGTLSDVAARISGFDGSNEFVAVWNASSWTTDEGCWIKYYGDGTGTDANVNQLDVIYSYMNDSGTQMVTMLADSMITCGRTVELQDLGAAVNKGYNYTCYCCNIKNLLNISDIADDIGLQTGEVLSWWDNSSQEWRAWIEGISHTDYDYTINVTSPIFETKVDNNYSWVISCP